MSYEPGTDPSAWQRPSAGSLPAPQAPAAASSNQPGPTPQLPPPTPGQPGQPGQPGGSARGKGRGKKFGLALLAVALMVGSGVVGALIATVGDDDGDPAPPSQATEASISVADARTGDLRRVDVAAVAEQIAPSVVTISSDVEGPFAESGQAVGTGVVITSSGEVLTNSHVVDGATDIRVRLAGESEPREAELLASDPNNDLALLQIAGSGFPAATFAQPDSVRIGDEVVAIGFALDLDGGPSVTSGIVSALDRTIQTGSDIFLDGLTQTDAAISSGNSGGPLVNAAGEVVGINTAVAQSDFQTAASNIGFAISVDETLRVVDQLRAQADGEEREQGFLGVELTERLDGGQGAIVNRVTDGTPAAEAGLVAGDVIVEVDGSPINGMTGLVAAIRDHQPGDEVEIVVVRDGEQVTLTATLAVRNEPS